MIGRIVAIFFLAAAMMVHAGSMSWNVSSRMAAIESLVNRGTLVIDASPFHTGDKYMYDGHFYSDKPPLLTLAGAGIALVLRAAHVDIVHQSRIFLVAITLGTVALSFGIVNVALFVLLVRYGFDRDWALGVATIAGFATLAFPFATSMINHVPAAAVLMCALVALSHSRMHGSIGGTATAGFAFAAAIGIDTSYVIFFVLAPIVLGRARIGVYLAYAVGALPIFAGLAIANMAFSGHVQPPDTNAALFDWPGSLFANGHIAGTIAHRSLGDFVTYGFGLIFGSHGLFLYSPILVVGTYALVVALRSRATSSELRSMLIFVAISVPAYVTSAIVGTIDFGGYSYGTRTFVGVSMLLCIPLGTLGSTLRARPTWRSLFLIIVAVSMLFAFGGVINPFPSYAFPLTHAWPDFVLFVKTHQGRGVYLVVALVAIAAIALTTIARALVTFSPTSAGADGGSTLYPMPLDAASARRER